MSTVCIYIFSSRMLRSLSVLYTGNVPCVEQEVCTLLFRRLFRRISLRWALDRCSSSGGVAIYWLLRLETRGAPYALRRSY